jgi:hypothetical protein
VVLGWVPQPFITHLNAVQPSIAYFATEELGGDGRSVLNPIQKVEDPLYNECNDVHLIAPSSTITDINPNFRTYRDSSILHARAEYYLGLELINGSTDGVCTSDSLELKVNRKGDFPEDSAYEFVLSSPYRVYTWRYDSLPGMISVDKSEVLPFNYQAFIRGSIQVSSDTIEVVVHKKPSYGLAGPFIYCGSGASNVVKLLNDTSFQSYEWCYNGEVYYNEPLTITGSGHFQIKVTDRNGCFSLSNEHVIRESEMGPVEIQLKGEEDGYFQLQANIGEGFTYTWYRDDMLLYGVNSFTILVKVGGKYRVNISNGTCSSSSPPFILQVV